MRFRLDLIPSKARASSVCLSKDCCSGAELRLMQLKFSHAALAHQIKDTTGRMTLNRFIRLVIF